MPVAEFEPFAVAGRRLAITASIGLAIAPPGTSVAAAIAAADAALYRAKAAGRNRVVQAVAEDFAEAELPESLQDAPPPKLRIG